MVHGARRLGPVFRDRPFEQVQDLAIQGASLPSADLHQLRVQVVRHTEHETNNFGHSRIHSPYSPLVLRCYNDSTRPGIGLAARNAGVAACWRREQGEENDGHLETLDRPAS